MRLLSLSDSPEGGGGDGGGGALRGCGGALPGDDDEDEGGGGALEALEVGGGGGGGGRGLFVADFSDLTPGPGCAADADNTPRALSLASRAFA